MSRKRRRPPPEDSRPGPRSLEDALYPTLDLHGESASDARRRAERWLRERQREAASPVRLITGRGLHSVGGAVLPAVVDELLTELRGSLIRRHEREPGGGVVRVWLHPPEPGGGSGGPSHRPDSSLRGPAGRDPELLRAARASLEELGITPIPALLDEEVRRLLRERERGGE